MARMDLRLGMLFCDLVFLAHSFPLGLFKNRLRGNAFVWRLESWEYSEQVHDCENDNPHDVNEVPI